MGKGTLTHQIIEQHLLSGELTPGQEVELKIDQCLLQDATGTMACQEFELLGLDRIRSELGIIYVDHNMVQIDHRNMEDHLFLQTFAKKYGLHYSRPGNGICHYVHLERFATPGKTLLGADSHTPMAGACASLAMGTGGLEVALALAGYPYAIEMPRVVGVELTGRLQPWVSAKDVILELLRRLTVKGGLHKVFEFKGEGVKTLSVTERGTICNMITELGATSGLFPSDGRTREWLRMQQREEQWQPLAADPRAEYDEEMAIALDQLEPLIAEPGNPDNVVPVREVAGLKIAQVCIGSSVNSSYRDMAIPAMVLKGKKVHPEIHMTLTPGSRQILDTITHSGVLDIYVEAGTRILEPACGPCVGMGQAPPAGLPSLRTMNRNFPGRSGTKDDAVFLCSPEVAGASALTGLITDPRDLGPYPKIEEPDPRIDDSFILPSAPPEEAAQVKIFRGQNIVPPPLPEPFPGRIRGRILIKLGNNISTGSISPDGVLTMADRSNIPAIAKYTFQKEDPQFVGRCREWGGGFILAGDNYGQGSSREHAALAPLHLGVKAVLAKDFARIHRRNLIAQAILPLYITDDFHQAVQFGDVVELPQVREEIGSGKGEVTALHNGQEYRLRHGLNDRERQVILAGGLIRYLRSQRP